MAKTQKYGIKYPFTINNDDGFFVDLNTNLSDGVKSQLLHLIFTPKGQKLRDPDFGTDLIRYIFEPGDSSPFNAIKTEIASQVNKYIPSVEFRDISIHKMNEESSNIVVIIEYGVKKGNKVEINTVGVKL